MKKWLYPSGAAALALVLVLTPAGAQDKKTLTIKDVMKKLNAGPNSLTVTIDKELQDDPPSWDDVKKDCKDFVKFAEALGKNTPPRGEKDSWDKLAKSYLDNAKALETAAGKEDKRAAQTAQKKLAAMDTCKGCHSEHKKR
jgi:hypothetical protein